jgi:hypothetical protein
MHMFYEIKFGECNGQIIIWSLRITSSGSISSSLYYMTEMNNKDTQQKFMLSKLSEFRKEVAASYPINKVGNFRPKARTITFY